MPAKHIPPLQFDVSVISQLACPACHGDLRLEAQNLDASSPVAMSHDNPSRLVCAACDRAYPIMDGIPVLIVDRAENRSPACDG
jgi:uncharacterized protein YbaR (Trm112 family)